MAAAWEIPKNPTNERGTKANSGAKSQCYWKTPGFYLYEWLWRLGYGWRPLVSVYWYDIVLVKPRTNLYLYLYNWHVPLDWTSTLSNSVGMVPVKSLSSKRSASRLVSAPISVGIVPENILSFYKNKICKIPRSSLESMKHRDFANSRIEEAKIKQMELHPQFEPS